MQVDIRGPSWNLQHLLSRVYADRLSISTVTTVSLSILVAIYRIYVSIRPSIHPPNHPINQSIDQSINQSVSQIKYINDT